jgi:hypothetical protein
MLSAPMLWSAEVPSFYRYIPEGVAELELLDPKDIDQFARVMSEIDEKCRPELLPAGEPSPQDFTNEAMLCPGRRILDDSSGSFKQFDRALSVRGIPQPPAEMLPSQS